MKSYLIEDIPEADLDRVVERLQAMELQSSLDDIFWLPLPGERLTDTQAEHLEECGPFCMALEVEPGLLRMELLVRSRRRLRCSCIGYATPDQRECMIQYLDDLLHELNVRT
jgi:hypothetical protein